jgi:hypothetical protein
MVCGGLWLMAVYLPSSSEPAVRSEVIDKMVLLFITNLVLGEFGSLLNREVASAKADLALIQAEYDTLKVRYNALAAVKEELSERIVGQTSSVISLYEASKSLDTIELEDVQEALLQLAVKFVGVSKVSLYWRDGNEKQLSWIRSVGWTEEEIAQASGRKIPFGEGAVGFAAERGRMYSLHQLQKLDEYAVLQKQSSMPSILVAPLNVGGHVVGVINVEELPFLKFTPTAVRLFFLIIDLGSSAIAKSRRFSALEELSVIEPDSGLHAGVYFDRALRSELQRFARAGAPFVYLLFRIADFGGLQQRLGKGLVRFERETAGLIFACKRDLDIISSTESKGTYRMLLPATDIQGAIAFIKKLRKSIFQRLKVRTKEETISVSASFICSEVSKSTGTDEAFAVVVQSMAKRLAEAEADSVIIGDQLLSI